MKVPCERIVFLHRSSLVRITPLLCCLVSLITALITGFGYSIVKVAKVGLSNGAFAARTEAVAVSIVRSTPSVQLLI